MKFDGRYSVEQVVYALDQYTDQKNDIPAPADILAILNPEKPRISEAAFVEAQKWQERNGWPIFSDAKDVIEAYREQEREKQTGHETKTNQITSMAGSALKRIQG